MLIASAYSGFVIWHAGLSGSIPLTLVTGAKFGEVTYQAAITETIFHPMNIIMCAVVLLAMPFINYAMHPDRERAVTIDPTLLVEDEDKTYEINTPAEKLEHSKILWGILCLAFLVYIIYYFITNGFTLGLNIVNHDLHVPRYPAPRRPAPLCGRCGGSRRQRLRRAAAVPLLCRYHGYDGGAE